MLERAKISVAFAGLMAAMPSPLMAADWGVSSSAGSSNLWPSSQAIDGNNVSLWSSNVHAVANSTEYFAFWFTGNAFHDVNYVTLRPRYGENGALGFPSSFVVYYSNGSQWVKSCEFKDFPTAKRGDDLILPLPAKVQANGILVVANQLSQDNVGNYVFQLAEARAGYEADFETKLAFLGNDRSLGDANEIQNVGSGDFDPNKLAVWHNDVRWPLIEAKPGVRRNLYNPSIVMNGATTWNVYFGGWDGLNLPDNELHDEISVSVTADDFLNFEPHYPMIGSGDFLHLNNPSVIKLADNSWIMASTARIESEKRDFPMIATATNGIDWNPSNGTAASLATIVNYPNIGKAQINGGNVLYQDGDGRIHLYFVDWANEFRPTFRKGTHHAISYDGGRTFFYLGVAQHGDMGEEDSRVVNDFKAFSVNGSTIYLLLTHLNGPDIRLTWSDDLNGFPTHQVHLQHKDLTDKYICSGGMVSNGKRLYGILYGASPDSELNKNSIFARWLQKKVIFKNDHVQWGDIEEAYGPNRVRLYTDSKIETGRFYVWDTDGTTLLYTSPRVTMKSGDIWKYLAP